MNNLFTKFFFLSYRRREIDSDLEKYSKYFKGAVLDVGGGRSRGLYKLDKKRISKMTICDIDKNKNPDIVANVEKLPFKNSSFDVVKATELLEHVQNPEIGLKECVRVIKNKGMLILSIPFIYRIHADPQDFQRFTEYKLKTEMEKLKCKIIVFKKQGYLFTVIADVIKAYLQSWPIIFRYFGYFFILPICELLVYLDKKDFMARSLYFSKFPEGYFLIAEKN